MNWLRKDRSVKLILLAIIAASAVLCVWQLAKIPSGLYWDEMDTGYQAFSFLKTGKDYFGNALPIGFHSFAEVRTPMFIYADVPFVALLGLVPIAVRLPAVLFSVLGLFAMFFLAKHFFRDSRWTLVPVALLAFSPWYFTYSRLSFEAITEIPIFLFALYSFFKAFEKNPKWLVVAAAFFGLLPYTYDTMKLSAPIMLLGLVAIYWKQLLAIERKYLVAAIVVLGIVVLPSVAINLLGGANQRFSENAVYTDPTVGPSVNYARLQSELGAGVHDQIGIKPLLIDQLLYNKPLLILDHFTTNYFEAFSPEFLFLTGDPNLRQSPDATGIGQLYRVTAIGLLCGIGYLFIERKRLGKKGAVLLFWLITAPLPSALTRDGGNHATRLLFMLPPLILVSSLGFFFLWTSLRGMAKKVVFVILGVIFVFEALFFYHYYFSVYHFESAQYFNFGFNQTIKIAESEKSHYSNIVIDAHSDSALMAYLFYAKINPATFQKRMPLNTENFNSDVAGFHFGKIWILPPGERSWRDYFFANEVPQNSIYIVAADELGSDDTMRDVRYYFGAKVESIIRYPDETPAFYVMEYK